MAGQRVATHVGRVIWFSGSILVDSSVTMHAGLGSLAQAHASRHPVEGRLAGLWVVDEVIQAVMVMMIT
jgi:hypothetical protein